MVKLYWGLKNLRTKEKSTSKNYVSNIVITIISGALCYAELGTMIPKSGGEHAYLNEVYGPPIAFLFAWTAIIVLKPSALAIISLSFGEYVVQPFYEGSECGPPTSATKIVAVLCVGKFIFLMLLVLNHTYFLFQGAPRYS